MSTTPDPTATTATTPNVFNFGEEELEILRGLSQDGNGNDTYSNDRALYGFIPAAHHLVVSDSMLTFFNEEVYEEGDKAKSESEVKWPCFSISDFGKEEHVLDYLGDTDKGTEYRDSTTYLYVKNPIETVKIALANYVSLINGGLKSPDAFVCAALRARWIALGALKPFLLDNARPYSEKFEVAAGVDAPTNILERILSSKVDDADKLATAAGEHIAKFMAEAKDEKHGYKWVVRYAETIWAAAEHSVRTKGHHFKPAYEAGLRKFIQAAHEGDGEIPSTLDLVHLFRTSIHPFGLASLPVMTAHFAVHGKLGNSCIVRFSASPNGMAVVTTTMAAIENMKSEAWWTQFKALFKDQIDLLEKATKAINSAKFSFHDSARLYGQGRMTGLSLTVNGVSKQYTQEELRNVGKVLAPHADGFAAAMEQFKKDGVIDDYSFSNARALKKHSMNSPLAALRIATLVRIAVNAIEDQTTIAAATRAALPLLEAKKEAEDAD